MLQARTDLEIYRFALVDVDAVVKWRNDNRIVLNTDKTKLLIIHSPCLVLNYSKFASYSNVHIIMLLFVFACQ